MAFFEVPRGTGGVTMSVSGRKGQGGSNVIRFGVSVEALKMITEDDVKSVLVQFGFARDLGKVLITPASPNHPSSYTLSNVSAHSKSVALSCAKVGIEFDECVALPCEYDRVNGSLVLRIPAEVMETAKFNSSGRLRMVKGEEMDGINKKGE
jgi:hypothetical protein